MTVDHGPQSSGADRHPGTLRLRHPAVAGVWPEHAAAASAAHGAPLVEIRRGPGAGVVFVIAPGTTRIGRGRDCDLVLEHPTVSAGHAELRRIGGRLRLGDAGSLNGTYRNGHAVGDAGAVLADGDAISIGVFTLIFHARPYSNDISRSESWARQDRGDEEGTR